MCIIAVIPKNVVISEEIFYTCWDNNPDGGGMMYALNNKVVVVKELNDYYKLYKQYVSASKLGVDIVLHFRVSTSGTIDKYNIHPFKIANGLHFCHNGMLNVHVPVGSKENDTQIFNNTILKYLPKNFIYDRGISKLLALTIGKQNKFVFLDSFGKIQIINKDCGHVEDGIWFSNKTYVPRQVKYAYHPSDTVLLKEECESCLNLTSSLRYNSFYNQMICHDCLDMYDGYGGKTKVYNYQNKAYKWNEIL